MTPQHEDGPPTGMSRREWREKQKTAAAAEPSPPSAATQPTPIGGGFARRSAGCT
ncbi:hypothetical protein G4G29_05340 [Microbacterium sp. Se63.02b]|nr:hypothetical protein G4G29_05340 [Microbacterium sp. Se63.02b]